MADEPQKEILKFRFSGIFTPGATKACGAGRGKTLETGQGKKISVASNFQNENSEDRMHLDKNISLYINN